jgi:hypothetical protein
MMWVKEWQAMLQDKSNRSPQSYPIDFQEDIYYAIRSYCSDIKVVYFPKMYEEYITWNEQYGHLYRVIDESLSAVPTQTKLQYFTKHSKLIQEQLREYKEIRELEQFSKKEKIQYHNDSIIEKIALAAHYAGLRSGG